tara:strand:+ start:17067 stop:17519 length:453 start_codon:yes stop_codon:yes gene_type:complete
MIPKRDEDGLAVIEKEQGDTPCSLCLRGQPEAEMIQADTRGLLQHIVHTRPESIQAPNDPQFATQVFMATNGVSEGADGVVLTANTYDWIHRILVKQIPITEKAEKSGVTKRTLGQALFGDSAYVVAEQLKDVDQRKTDEQIFSTGLDED